MEGAPVLEIKIWRGKNAKYPTVRISGSSVGAIGLAEGDDIRITHESGRFFLTQYPAVNAKAIDSILKKHRNSKLSQAISKAINWRLDV